MTFRTGCSDAPTRTRSDPRGGAGIGRVGRYKGIAPGEGGIDAPSQDLPAGERPNVVLGKDVPSQLQALPDRWRVTIRHALERCRMIGCRVAQHDVQIDRCDVGRVLDFELVDHHTCRPHRVERCLEHGAYLIVHDVAEIAAEHGQPETRGRGNCDRLPGRTPEQDSVDPPGVAHRERQRPDVVERARERHDALGRQLAEGWLQANHAAGRRRDPDRPTRVASQSCQGHSSSNAGGRTTA